jgi:hypothetical protein
MSRLTEGGSPWVSHLVAPGRGGRDCIDVCSIRNSDSRISCAESASSRSFSTRSSARARWPGRGPGGRWWYRAAPVAPRGRLTVRVSVERDIRVKLCKTCSERVRSWPRHTKLRRPCAANDRLRVDKTIPDNE